MGSSLVTCTLIEPQALQQGGTAANRALAYLAHGESAAPIGPMFGETFGTIYDITTVVILWFAGASAMSGLLSLVPRYLPRYGMAPRWAEAFRPLVVLFTVVGLLVTWVFDASVEAQGGAYATGVMVLITSACVAVVIDQWRKRAHVTAGIERRRRTRATHHGCRSTVSPGRMCSSPSCSCTRPWRSSWRSRTASRSPVPSSRR